MTDFKSQWIRRTSKARKHPDPNAILQAGGPGALRRVFDRAKVIDLHPSENFVSQLKRAEQHRNDGHGADNLEQQKSRLQPLGLDQFLTLEIKPREMVLNPIIPEKGIVMIYGFRGIGKTHIADGIAYAVATGGKFLQWEAPKARHVLLVDGEMPAVDLRDRLKAIVAAGGETESKPKLQVIAGDLIEEGGVGNLASSKAQKELEPHLNGIELLILDNLSSLTAVLRDNDAESWEPIQSWLLRLRRRGISVLIIHHAGKGGAQRGTSRREDVLDTSISLRRPSDYVPTQGARFEVHIEKGRAIHGDAAKPFEAQLVRDTGGAPCWTTKAIEDAQKARVAALLDDDLSVREIAEDTGIPKSTVHRLKKQIEAEKVAQLGRGTRDVE
jgi:putative DNA primase/helicase